jgi:hypothetical protein
LKLNRIPSSHFFHKSSAESSIEFCLRSHFTAA